MWECRLYQHAWLTLEAVTPEDRVPKFIYDWDNKPFNPDLGLMASVTLSIAASPILKSVKSFPEDKYPDM